MLVSLDLFFFFFTSDQHYSEHVRLGEANNLLWHHTQVQDLQTKVKLSPKYNLCFFL